MIRVGWIISLCSSSLISLCCPCCFIPLVLNVFGIGCAGLNNFLLPYRPVFISFTVVSLTYSYFRYRPSHRRFMMIVLIAFLLTFSSDILRMYKNKTNDQSSTSDSLPHDVVITHWQIIGLHCESCRATAERALRKVDGVISVNVDLDSGQADVIARTPIENDVIIRAVEAVGFQIFKIV